MHQKQRRGVNWLEVVSLSCEILPNYLSIAAFGGAHYRRRIVSLIIVESVLSERVLITFGVLFGFQRRKYLG